MDPSQEFVKMKKIVERLDREILGFLCDMGIMEQRTDEFIDQEKHVRKFLDKWRAALDKIEEKVMKQIDKGKTEVAI